MGFFDLFKSSSPAKTSTSCECDICSKKMTLSDGYLLTTKDVVVQKAYWEYAFTHQWGYVHDLGGTNADPEMKTRFLANLLINQINQNTPWSICETCSNFFTFDKKTAKKYAQKNISPPNTGYITRAEGIQAAVAFMDAWKKVYNEELPDLRKEL